MHSNYRRDQARKQAALRNNLLTTATWEEILAKSLETTRAVLRQRESAGIAAEKALASEEEAKPPVIDRKRMQKLCDAFHAKQREMDNSKCLSPVENAYKPEHRVSDDELIMANSIGQGLHPDASADDLAMSHRCPGRTRRHQLTQLEPLARPFAADEKQIELDALECMYRTRDRRREPKPRPVRTSVEAILPELKRNLRGLDPELGL